MTIDAATTTQQPERSHGRSASLRARLILANAIITILAVAAMGYYVYYRGQQSTEALASQLESSVRQEAENQLSATADQQAEAVDSFFATMRREITDAGASTAALLSHEPGLSTGAYWNAIDSIARLPSGSWDNPTTGPASIFMPARTALTDTLALELNTLKHLDFVVPQKLQANPDAVAMYFGGMSGETVYYPDVDLANVVPPDFDVTQRPWYVKAAPSQDPDRKAVWSDPYLDAALHGLVVTSSTPVYDANGAFRGVIAIDIQLGRISDLVSNIHVGKTGYAFLIDRDQRLIAMPPSGYADIGIAPDKLPLGDSLDPARLSGPIAASLAGLLDKMTSGQSGLESISLGGIDRFAVYRPVPEVGYSMVILVPSSELLGGSIVARQQLAAASANTTRFSLALVAIILGLAIAATIILGNSLIAPLTGLTTTASEIIGGNLDARAPVKSGDEIGILSQTLNTMTANLQQLVQTLEERVKDRTAALERASQDSTRRAAQFEAVTRVTAAISSLRNLDELMPVVSQVISEQFGYYHVGIFLNDDNGQATRLIAANSEGGRRMLDRRHSLKIGEQGIVGYVAGRGQPRVAHNVGEDAVFFSNPDLPETKAEAALPLRSAERVIGVLDVQSTEEKSFTPDDLGILAVLADQVSLAVENARLFETTRRTLTEAETLYRQYVREAWQGTHREPQVTGFRFDGQRSYPLHAGENPAESPAGAGGAPESPAVAINVPIELRGETIGELVVKRLDSTPWTQDQLDLVRAVAERVALSAENARLFEETGRRAERERLVTEITSKIRRSNDPSEMVQTALEELQRALGASRVQLIPHTVADAMKAKEAARRPTQPRAAESPRNDEATP
jgi:GAF domain-containing protein/HAMP domain-containing protein